VAPMDQIMRLRRKATSDFEIKDGNNGYGHEKAFLNIIEKWGTLHEGQMPIRSYGQGSMVRGQLEPGAVKQLLDSAGTGVNTIKKVGIRKVMLHHKLPDQKNVKKIFHEIESKDERLELNLYIVGEEGDTDE
jgi:succinate dehydrogenase / fumarate reductase iron-sulfur subunit